VRSVQAGRPGVLNWDRQGIQLWDDYWHSVDNL
jgi:hypothetical protein